MDGEGKFDHIRRDLADFVDQFTKAQDEADASETLIASAEYELELLKRDFRFARLPSSR